MTENDDLQIIRSDDGLIADVRAMIEQTREGVARTVNAGMTLLYWRIGKRIQTDVLGNQRAEYGKEILATLSQELGWSHFKEIIPLNDDLARELLQQKLHAAIEISRARLAAKDEAVSKGAKP